MAACTHMLENGRLDDLQRSLLQLIERGARLTEATYLPLISFARSLGAHAMARAVLELAQAQDAYLTEKSYSEVIRALLSTASLEDAEAVALSARTPCHRSCST